MLVALALGLEAPLRASSWTCALLQALQQGLLLLVLRHLGLDLILELLELLEFFFQAVIV